MAGSMLEALEKVDLVTPQMRKDAENRGQFTESTERRRQKELAQKDEQRFEPGICSHCFKDQKLYRDKKTKELVIAPHHYEHDLCPGSHMPPEKPVQN